MSYFKFCVHLSLKHTVQERCNAIQLLFYYAVLEMSKKLYNVSTDFTKSRSRTVKMNDFPHPSTSVSPIAQADISEDFKKHGRYCH
jgi:hypothetical protein